jgi:ADP-heptose:LPS heptosyltransferase
VKKILVIKHGSLGDIILALPAFASIRTHYNKSEIFLLTEKKYFKFFEKCTYIDNCIEDNRKDNFFITLKRIIKLFHNKYDLIIDLQNSRRTSFYNLLFSIFQSTKVCSSRSFADFRYHIPIQGIESVREGLFNQLKLIGVNRIINEDYSWLKIKLSERFVKPLALFIPGVSKNGNHKQWQPYKFAAIAKYFENLNFTICVIGNKEDEKSVLPIIESCNNVVNKIDLSPPEVIYSLALNSKIIFSNDTGPGHIASLAKNNFIWIVNDNNVSRANQPFGSHVYKIQSRSVKEISVQTVLSLIEKNELY